MLNDFFDFPKSALTRLADAKAEDRRIVAQKLAWASSVIRGAAVDWEGYVPSLIPYLNDHDSQVRASIVEALVNIRKPADKIVPALIAILDAHARVMLHDPSDERVDPSDERIVRGLEEIEARWYDRREFNESVKTYVNRFPRNLD